MKILSHIAGSFFWALALAYIVIDGAKTLSANSFMLTSLGQALYEMDQTLGTGMINSQQSDEQKQVHSVPWDPFITTILTVPASIFCLVAGTLCNIPRKKQKHARYKHIEDL